MNGLFARLALRGAGLPSALAVAAPAVGTAAPAGEATPQEIVEERDAPVVDALGLLDDAAPLGLTEPGERPTTRAVQPRREAAPQARPARQPRPAEANPPETAAPPTRAPTPDAPMDLEPVRREAVDERPTRPVPAPIVVQPLERAQSPRAQSPRAQSPDREPLGRRPGRRPGALDAVPAPGPGTLPRATPSHGNVPRPRSRVAQPTIPALARPTGLAPTRELPRAQPYQRDPVVGPRPALAERAVHNAPVTRRVADEPRLPAAADPTTSSQTPIELRIGTIELHVATPPAPAAPPDQPVNALPVGFDAYAALR